MSRNLLVGGLMAGYGLMQELSALNTTGLADTENTAPAPYGIGIINDDRDDTAVNTLQAGVDGGTIAFAGQPGWSNGTGTPNSFGNIVIAFVKSLSTGGGSAFVNAADVQAALEAGGAPAVQQVINAWQYLGLPGPGNEAVTS